MVACQRMMAAKVAKVVEFKVNKYEIQFARFSDRPDMECEIEELRITPRLLV